MKNLKLHTILRFNKELFDKKGKVLKNFMCATNIEFWLKLIMTVQTKGAHELQCQKFFKHYFSDA